MVFVWFSTEKVFYGFYCPKVLRKCTEFAIGRGYKHEILAPETLNLNFRWIELVRERSLSLKTEPLSSPPFRKNRFSCSFLGATFGRASANGNGDQRRLLSFAGRALVFAPVTRTQTTCQPVVTRGGDGRPPSSSGA